MVSVKFLSVSDAMKALNTDEATFFELCREGEVRFCIYSGRWRTRPANQDHSGYSRIERNNSIKIATEIITSNALVVSINSLESWSGQVLHLTTRKDVRREQLLVEAAEINSPEINHPEGSLELPRVLQAAIRTYQKFWEDFQKGERRATSDQILDWLRCEYPDISESQRKRIDKLVRPASAASGGNLRLKK